VNARTHFFGAIASLALVAGWVRADQAPPFGEPLPAEPAPGSLQKEQGALRTELDLLAARGQEAQRRLLTRGRVLYRLARVGILPVGGGLSSLFEHAARVERTRRALEQDLAESRTIADRKVVLLRKLGEVSSRQARADAERERLARASAPLDGDGLDSVRFSAGTQPELGVEGATALGANRDARIGLDPSPSLPSAAASIVDGFRGMKGRLPLPVFGKADIRRVRRPGASGPGLEMLAPAGTTVRAVFPGRVAFADRYDSFGSVVILDHGDHFYTLMGDLGSTDVRVGDDLSAGARIGTVGPASGNRRDGDNAFDRGSPARRPAVLYFEIRSGSSTLDPGPWLGL
jgi:murein DD-endopeptidase MepM/ murein hydrolase activator NlpD